MRASINFDKRNRGEGVTISLRGVNRGPGVPRVRIRVYADGRTLTRT